MMVASPERGASSGSADGAVAARDTLVELLSIVTHDLNNPLQSLIVLLELSVDDAPAGSETRTRAEQCQQAAERIKTLTAALAGLLRGRREDGPRVWARAEALLGRRFERVGIPSRADVQALADLTLPNEFFFALCGACLLVLGTASNVGVRGLELRVTGAVVAGDAQLALALVATGEVPGAVAPAWEPAAAQRLVDLVAAEPGLSLQLSPGTITLVARREDAIT
jgi:signal transduction histidine kinase